MATKIPFHIPFISGSEQSFVQKVISSNRLGTGGYYSQSCQTFLEDFTKAEKVLLTSSCTHALEMAALLFDIQPGDEVIMPSYNFVSAANAFVLRGAKIVFVDIDPISMNIDPDCLASAITEKTKAVLIMHYGGVACEMDRIMPIIKSNKLFLVEDAAHCIGSTYKGQHLGTFGDLGTISFHYTKNIHCGEGGALLINNCSMIDRAEIIREKGTNRKQFFEGKVDKYSWVDLGSSYLMSELSAAFLWGQLSEIDKVNNSRRIIFQSYAEQLSLKSLYIDNISKISIESNAHCFFVKCESRESRKIVIENLKKQGIDTSFHYVPLHYSPAGAKYGRFHEIDKYTTTESNRLLRLPIYPGLKIEDISNITSSLTSTTLDYEGIQS